jgi:hypothetical protein
LFAFHTSAEDAEYLAEELGGGLDKQDLLELGHYQCYVRITDVRNGERLQSFSVRLDAPPASDAELADRLAAESADRYGRSVVDVELDLEAASARIRPPDGTQQAGRNEPEGEARGESGTGSPSAVRTPVGGQVPSGRRAPRNAGGTPSRQTSRNNPRGGEHGQEPAA